MISMLACLRKILLFLLDGDTLREAGIDTQSNTFKWSSPCLHSPAKAQPNHPSADHMQWQYIHLFFLAVWLWGLGRGEEKS